MVLGNALVIPVFLEAALDTLLDLLSSDGRENFEVIFLKWFCFGDRTRDFAKYSVATFAFLVAVFALSDRAVFLAWGVRCEVRWGGVAMEGEEFGEGCSAETGNVADTEGGVA